MYIEPSDDIMRGKIYKDGCEGGLTEEQRKNFLEIDDWDESWAYYGKCKEENQTDEYKEFVAKGGGLRAPKYNTSFKDRKLTFGKLVEVAPEDF